MAHGKVFMLAAAVLLLSLAVPTAEAAYALNVTAKLCCSNVGNCFFNSPPLVDQTVTLKCITKNLTEITVGANSTDASGRFSVQVSASSLSDVSLPIPPVGLLPCGLSIRFPVTSCASMNVSRGGAKSALFATNNGLAPPQTKPANASATLWVPWW